MPLPRNDPVRLDIERLQRDNYLKRVDRAMDDAIYWLRHGKSVEWRAVQGDQIDAVIKKLTKINKMAERLRGIKAKNAITE
jgi:hypothetical protein